MNFSESLHAELKPITMIVLGGVSLDHVSCGAPLIGYRIDCCNLAETNNEIYKLPASSKKLNQNDHGRALKNSVRNLGAGG